MSEHPKKPSEVAELHVDFHIAGQLVAGVTLTNADPIDWDSVEPGDVIRFRVESVEERTVRRA